MYILIQEKPFKITTFEAKIDLARALNIHRNTVTARFEKKNPFETKKGTAYKVHEHIKRYRSGNKDDWATKKGKQSGEIPLKGQ